MSDEKITRLVIMDFDGTLMDTMTPEVGKEIWRETTGFDWPHVGWWSKEESLDIVVFGTKPIEKVIEAYKTEVDGEGTWMVMMTGRLPRLSGHVKNILEKHELVFDEYIFNTGGTTIGFKIKELKSFCERFVNLDTIEIYEDRPEHTIVFREWGDSIEKTVTVHQV